MATSYSKNLHYQAKLPSFYRFWRKENTKMYGGGMPCAVSAHRKNGRSRRDFDTGDFNSERKDAKALQKRG